MIRTIRPTDVLRLILDGRHLDPDCSHTWDKLGVYQDTIFKSTQNAGSVILHGEKELCIVVANGMHLDGLASVRLRSGPTTWEVHFLNLPNRSIADSVSLLEFVCILAGNHGARKIFLRVPIKDPVIELARQAGFELLFKETLYKKTGANFLQTKPNLFFDNFHVKTDNMLYRIYNECVPLDIKSGYGLTFDEWRDSFEPTDGAINEAIYLNGDRIHGWIRVITGKNDINRMEITVHPVEELSVWQEAVNWGLNSGIKSNPYLILVADHQTSLRMALERSGFIPNETYQLMAISLAVRVEMTEFMPARA